MPNIATVKCSTCSFQLPTGAGGFLYVIDTAGARIPCPHPCEADVIERVTGLDWSAARQKGLIGCISHCVCWDCVHQFDLDVERDVKRCPACGSLNVRTVGAALGSRCPKCNQGALIEESHGVS
jgi:DNA-directed RNA polymerase subunit RPC12/RpoP